MPDKREKYLVVGLGNPGVAYDFTRHNVGHDVVCAFAKDQSWAFVKNTSIEGKIAHGIFQGVQVFLLLPTTYMNNSGIAMHKCLQYFAIDSEHALVIADDIFTAFGSMRLRQRGSAGGHNGLKSVENALSTQDYHRLRIGVGNIRTCALEEHVLSRFNTEEMKYIPEIIRHATGVIAFWLEGDFSRAALYATTINRNTLEK